MLPRGRAGAGACPYGIVAWRTGTWGQPPVVAQRQGRRGGLPLRHSSPGARVRRGKPLWLPSDRAGTGACPNGIIA